MKIEQNKAIRLRVNVEDCEGYFLAERAKRIWVEDFVDENTGEIVSIERSEIVAHQGAYINTITKSLLVENGIKEVLVSDVQLKGIYSVGLALWEVTSRITDKGKSRSMLHIVTEYSPSKAEEYIINELEQHVEGLFNVLKIAPAKYDKIVRVNQKDIERLKETEFKWFKTVLVVSGLESDYKRTLLIQASSLRKIQNIVQDIHEDIDETTFDISEIKEVNIEDVFIPTDAAVFYNEKSI